MVAWGYVLTWRLVDAAERRSYGRTPNDVLCGHRCKKAERLGQFRDEVMTLDAFGRRLRWCVSDRPVARQESGSAIEAVPSEAEHSARNPIRTQHRFDAFTNAHTARASLLVLEAWLLGHGESCVSSFSYLCRLWESSQKTYECTRSRSAGGNGMH